MKMKNEDVYETILSAVSILCLFVLTLLLLSGCSFPRPRYVQGVDVSLGLSVPATDGAAQISLFEYISGIKMSSTTNLPFKVVYKEWTTNSYFGVVNVNEHRETEVDMKPVK